LRAENRLAAGRVGAAAENEDMNVLAPLPGLVVEVRVAEGQPVEEGDVIVVLESMKMNLELRAPRSGVVRALKAAAGREVSLGEKLAVVGEDAPQA
jgi:biotin carboxyl carrier protein